MKFNLEAQIDFMSGMRILYNLPYLCRSSFLIIGGFENNFKLDGEIVTLVTLFLSDQM